MVAQVEGWGRMAHIYSLSFDRGTVGPQVEGHSSSKAGPGAIVVVADRNQTEFGGRTPTYDDAGKLVFESLEELQSTSTWLRSSKLLV